jgi:hypothetical protein
MNQRGNLKHRQIRRNAKMESLVQPITWNLNFNHSCALSVSFDDFLIYQVMKNLANHFPYRAGFGSGSSA